MKTQNKIKNIVLVSDFDGTISKKDFFAYATEKIIPNDCMHPWKMYKQGKIRHVQALNLIFNNIKLPKSDFNSFIDTIEIEEYFAPTVELCIEKNIEVFVVSAGADYYISRILNNLNLTKKLKLITNPSTYSEEKGLELIPLPKENELYDEELGVSKKAFVQKLQEQGNFVIFAGDGMPDIEAAKVADVVFARDYLITLCESANIDYKKFDTYQDIFLFISNC